MAPQFTHGLSFILLIIVCAWTWANIYVRISSLYLFYIVHFVQVGTDFLEEEITKFEDLVQSVDIAAFNKI